VLDARREQERELSAVLAELAAEADAGGDRVAAIRWAQRRLALDPLSEEAARDRSRSGARPGAAMAASPLLRERAGSARPVSLRS
jgi:hypothetical protein